MATMLSGDAEQKPILCSWKDCSCVYNSVRILARHVIEHAVVGQLCQWSDCGFFSRDEKYLEVHVLQHIYRDVKYVDYFSSLDLWASELPTGQFMPTYTDLSLCPPLLRCHLGLLLFDQHFKLPNNLTYTALDHEQFLIRLQQEQPEKFFEQTEEYRISCEERGVNLEFNSKVWTRAEGKFKRKLSEMSSCQTTTVLKPSMDVYVVKQPPNTEVAGNTGKLVLHTCTSQPPQIKRRCIVNEPWMDKVRLNLQACHEAIGIEICFLSDLFSKGFLSAKSDTLVSCEKLVFRLASYPSCTDGVLFFTMFKSSNDEYYIRLLESGCYTNFLIHSALDSLCQCFQTTRDKIFLSQISTEIDILDQTEKINMKKTKSKRQDKAFKTNMCNLRKNLGAMISSAKACEVSVKYFLHVAAEGYGANLSEGSSDMKCFLASDLDETFVKEMKTRLVSFPIYRQEEKCKTEMNFCEEAFPHASSILDQSMFLNYLSNDPYRFLKDTVLRYCERFPTSSNPASLRYKIMSACWRGDYACVRDLLQQVRNVYM